MNTVTQATDPSVDIRVASEAELAEVFRAVFTYYATVFRVIPREAPPEVAYPPVVWLSEYVNDALRLGHARSREFFDCLVAANPVLVRFDAMRNGRVVLRAAEASSFEGDIRAREDAARQRDLAYTRLARAERALEKAREEDAAAKKLLQDLQDAQDVQH
jgi:hypothetical protein